MEFWTTASVRAVYTIPSGIDAMWITRRLGNPDDVISIRQPTKGNVTVRIPVRSIATVIHTITRTPIENG